MLGLYFYPESSELDCFLQCGQVKPFQLIRTFARFVETLMKVMTQGEMD